MIINTENAKAELIKLNSLIDEYEKNTFSIYNEFKNAESFWNDENSKLFFQDIQKEKVNMQNTFSELKDVEKIYAYIISSYGKFGKVLNIEISAKDEIINGIKRYVNKLEKIINSYRNLDIKGLDEVNQEITMEVKTLVDTYKKSNKLYVSINNFYNEIEKINKEVSIRISRFNISPITVSKGDL